MGDGCDVRSVVGLRGRAARTRDGDDVDESRAARRSHCARQALWEQPGREHRTRTNSRVVRRVRRGAFRARRVERGRPWPARADRDRNRAAGAMQHSQAAHGQREVLRHAPRGRAGAPGSGCAAASLTDPSEPTCAVRCPSAVVGPTLEQLTRCSRRRRSSRGTVTVGRYSSSSIPARAADSMNGCATRLGDGRAPVERAEVGDQRMRAVEQPQLHQLVGLDVVGEHRAAGSHAGRPAAKRSSITHIVNGSAGTAICVGTPSSSYAAVAVGVRCRGHDAVDHRVGEGRRGPSSQLVAGARRPCEELADQACGRCPLRRRLSQLSTVIGAACVRARRSSAARDLPDRGAWRRVAGEVVPNDAGIRGRAGAVLGSMCSRVRSPSS